MLKRYLYMILAGVCLGTVGVFVKLINKDVSDLHFMSLNFYRIFIGFLFLLIAAPIIDKDAFKVTRKELKNYFVVGLMLTLALSTYTTANLFTSVQNAVLIHYSYPFFVLILAYFFLKEEITKTKIISLIIAIFGLAIINPFKLGAGTMGDILALVSAIFYGFLIIGMRKNNLSHGIGDAMWFFFFGSLILFPFAFYYGLGNFSFYLIGLGVATGLGHLFYNLALHKVEAEIGAIIATVVAPLVSIVLAALIVGEVVQLRIVIGGVILVFAGVYLQTHNRKEKNKKNANLKSKKRKKIVKK